MKPGCIRTFKGNYVDVQHPNVDDIDPEDLAHHLAMECRWGGATKRHYSVAEHSIWVCRFVSHMVPLGQRDIAQLYALLHDGHEAYLKDISTPIKVLLGERYKQLSMKLDLAIWKRFHLPPPRSELSEALHEADLYAAWHEKQVLLAPCRKLKTDFTKEPPEKLKQHVGMESGIQWPNERVDKMWLQAVNYLVGQVG